MARYYLPMRATVAALLLLLQLEPVGGVVLCLGLSASNAEYMEDGCPMPRASDETSPPPRSTGQSELGVLADAHECAFAEVCNLTPTLARSLDADVSSIPPSTDRVRWAATPRLLTDGSAPPVPPPRA